MTQKVAYVTGGMGGIGTSICRRLHQEGFKVIAGCGPTRDFNKWLDEQKADGYTFYASVGNVADWDSTVEAFQKAIGEHGTIDVLVNNAGITKDRMFLKMTREDWDAVISTNLTSMFNVTKQVVPGMVEKGCGPHHPDLARSTAKRVRLARPTTRPPRPACTASRWPWRRNWRPRA
jgi:acetoacetyl-CoA reductase